MSLKEDKEDRKREFYAYKRLGNPLRVHALHVKLSMFDDITRSLKPKKHKKSK